MVTKTSAGTDSLPYRMGCALQNIPQSSLGSIRMVTSGSGNGLCFIPQRPRPWAPSQLLTLVPFAVAKSRHTGCLGISWPSVISGWFMWRRKARLSHLHILPYGNFLSISYLSQGWHLGHFLLQLALSNSSQWPGRSATAEGQAMLDWDKVHLTWQVCPRPPRAVGGALYLTIQSRAAGGEWGIGPRIDRGLSHFSTGLPWRRQA